MDRPAEKPPARACWRWVGVGPGRDQASNSPRWPAQDSRSDRPRCAGGFRLQPNAHFYLLVSVVVSLMIADTAIRRTSTDEAGWSVVLVPPSRYGPCSASLLYYKYIRNTFFVNGT